MKQNIIIGRSISSITVCQWVAKWVLSIKLLLGLTTLTGLFQSIKYFYLFFGRITCVLRVVACCFPLSLKIRFMEVLIFTFKILCIEFIVPSTMPATLAQMQQNQYYLIWPRPIHDNTTTMFYRWFKVQMLVSSVLLSKHSTFNWKQKVLFWSHHSFYMMACLHDLYQTADGQQCWFWKAETSSLQPCHADHCC